MLYGRDIGHPDTYLTWETGVPLTVTYPKPQAELVDWMVMRKVGQMDTRARAIARDRLRWTWCIVFIVAVFAQVWRALAAARSDNSLPLADLIIRVQGNTNEETAALQTFLTRHLVEGKSTAEALADLGSRSKQAQILSQAKRLFMVAIQQWTKERAT